DQFEQVPQAIGVVCVVDIDLDATAQGPALEAAGIVVVGAAEACQHATDGAGPDPEARGRKRGGGAVLHVVGGQSAQGQRHVPDRAEVVHGLAVEQPQPAVANAAASAAVGARLPQQGMVVVDGEPRLRCIESVGVAPQRCVVGVQHQGAV